MPSNEMLRILIVTLLAAATTVVLVRQLRGGRVWTARGSFARQEYPYPYWWMIAIYAAVTLALYGSLAALVVRLLGDA